jgi:hypothetical protein
MNAPNRGEVEEKYVVCIPRWCGLNDTLVQIWFAYQYAQEHSRHVFIDTRSTGFWDDFDNYFVLTDVARETNVISSLRISNSDMAFLNKQEVHPRRYQGCLEFAHHEIHLRSGIAHKRSRVDRILSFVGRALISQGPHRGLISLRDRLRFLSFVASPTGPRDPDLLHESRAEQVVVRHLSGGGKTSIQALSLFTLNPDLQTAVRGALNLCGDDYDAIHIRNTDKTSRYEELLAGARERLAGRRVLVCSDDASVIDVAHSMLPDSDVFTVSTVQPAQGRPLHKIGWNLSAEQRRTLNYSMIIDLICMARSANLLVAAPTDLSPSGFSTLARLLHRRADILSQLVGTD